MSGNTRYIDQLRQFMCGFGVVPAQLNANAWREFLLWLNKCELPTIDKVGLTLLTDLLADSVEVSYCHVVQLEWGVGGRASEALDTVFFDSDTNDVFKVRYKLHGDDSLYYKKEFDHANRINLDIELTTATGKTYLKERVRQYPSLSEPSPNDLEKQSLHSAVEIKVTSYALKHTVYYGFNPLDPTVIGRHQLDIAYKLENESIPENYLTLLNKLQAGDMQAVMVKLMFIEKGGEKLSEIQVGNIAKKVLIIPHGSMMWKGRSHASECLTILSRISERPIWDLIELTPYDIYDVKCMLFTDIDSLEILLKGRPPHDFDAVLTMANIQDVQLCEQQKAFLLQGSFSQLSALESPRKARKL